MDAPILLSFVIIMLRRKWLAKDEIDIIDLLNASDAFVFKIELIKIYLWN